MRQKKFRGNKRYYRKLYRRAEEFHIDLGGLDDWYDLWHVHFDWYGRGNKKGKARAEHIKALFTAFENILNQTKTYQKPYQTFLSFNETDSSQDAIYFHTPNPNETNFPYTFESVEWGIPVPAFLRQFMKDKHEIGRQEFEGKTWYTIRTKST